jgi:hypothetical protein
MWMRSPRSPRTRSMPRLEIGCARWVHQGTILDVIPLDERILGFSNRWYPGAMEAAVRRRLADDLEIRMVTAPFFVATKLEAFKGRGRGDFFGSRDLEDFSGARRCVPRWSTSSQPSRISNVRTLTWSGPSPYRPANQLLEDYRFHRGRRCFFHLAYPIWGLAAQDGTG